MMRIGRKQPDFSKKSVKIRVIRVLSYVKRSVSRASISLRQVTLSM